VWKKVVDEREALKTGEGKRGVMDGSYLDVI
jgi:hypothetical protein